MLAHVGAGLPTFWLPPIRIKYFVTAESGGMEVDHRQPPCGRSSPYSSFVKIDKIGKSRRNYRSTFDDLLQLWP